MAKKKKAVENAQDVTDEELQISFSGPAIFVNKAYVTLGSGGVRIAFAEVREETGPKFRSAIMLSPQDALGLRDVLQRVLGEFERQINELRSSTKDDG